jgi:hypothetical protein
VNDVKKWRELRREIRRAKEPSRKGQLEAELKDVETRMTPKQLKSIKEEYDLGVL